MQITLAARLRKEQYMAFGISGAEGRPAMLGADVVVAYWDTKYVAFTTSRLSDRNQVKLVSSLDTFLLYVFY